MIFLDDECFIYIVGTFVLRYFSVNRAGFANNGSRIGVREKQGFFRRNETTGECVTVQGIYKRTLIDY